MMKRAALAILVLIAGLLTLVSALPLLQTAHFPPNKTDASSFLSQFWPQLIATLFGVAGGIPSGFYVQRRLQMLHEQRASLARAERWKTIQTALWKALERNQAQLQELRSCIGTEGWFFDIGLETASWDILQDDAKASTDDVLFLAELGGINHRLIRIARLSELYREYDSGLLSEKASRGPILHDLGEELDRLAADLVTEIQTARDRMETP